MIVLRPLCVLAVLLALLMYSADTANAAPFPTLAFQVNFPTMTGTRDPCDEIDCEGEAFSGQSASLPRFALTGETLLTVQFSYDLKSQAESININNTDSTVFTVTNVAARASLGGVVQDTKLSEIDFVSATVPPHQQVSLGSVSAEVAQSLVLLPGDNLFPPFLSDLAGNDNLPLFASWSAEENGIAILGPPCVGGCSGMRLAPNVVSFTFSGSVDLTYRYCTPGADLGCPDAIPGFNSPGVLVLPPPPPPLPVPGPMTLFLFAAGLASLAGTVRTRRHRANTSGSGPDLRARRPTALRRVGP